MPVFPDCGRPLTADVVITGCDIVEDHLDEISRCAGFLMMDGGDALYDFDLLGRRQPPSSRRASVGWHLILRCRNGGRGLPGSTAAARIPKERRSTHALRNSAPKPLPQFSVPPA